MLLSYVIVSYFKMGSLRQISSEILCGSSRFCTAPDGRLEHMEPLEHSPQMTGTNGMFTDAARLALLGMTKADFALVGKRYAA